MIWNFIRNLLGICGGMLLYLAVSTSDYYVMELGQAEPQRVRTMLVIGVLMVLPAVVGMIVNAVKER